MTIFWLSILMFFCTFPVFPSHFDLSFRLFAFNSMCIYLFFFFFHFNLQMKSPVDCEANGINHSNDNLISNAEITSMQCDERGGGAAGHAGQMNHHSSANGSLTTMTMKNNHLIVETEERSVSIRQRLTYKHEHCTHTHTHLQLEHLSNARDPSIFIVVFPRERGQNRFTSFVKLFARSQFLSGFAFLHIFLAVFEFFTRLRYISQWCESVRYPTEEKPITIISSTKEKKLNSFFFFIIHWIEAPKRRITLWTHNKQLEKWLLATERSEPKIESDRGKKLLEIWMGKSVIFYGQKFSTVRIFGAEN